MEKHNKIKLPKILRNMIFGFSYNFAILYANKIRILSFVQRKHILFIKGSTRNTIVQPFSLRK